MLIDVRALLTMHGDVIIFHVRPLAEASTYALSPIRLLLSGHASCMNSYFVVQR